MIKKLTHLSLCFAMIALTQDVSLFAGGAAEKVKGVAVEEATVSSNRKSRTMVDPAGYTVELPADVNKVVILCMPHPEIFCAVDGGAEKIIGMNPSTKMVAENSILGKVWPKLKSVPTDFVSTEFEVNAEELLKLNPEVVFQWSTKVKEIEKMEAVGIKVVRLYHSDAYAPGGGAEAMIDGWLRQFGELLGKQARAEEIIGYRKEVIKKIAARTADVPVEKRPRVLAVSRIDPQINVSGSSDAHMHWMIHTAGGVNAAQIEAGWGKPVDMERVLSWDPQIIFIGNFIPNMPEDILESRIKGQDWSHVAAVKRGQVYKNPMGGYRWDVLCAETPLSLLWMAKRFYPDRFADWSLPDEMKGFYRRFFGYELSDEEVEWILHSTGTSRYSG